ncbi:MAG: energy-coupling factor ABC transporter ATP-binding protein [Candidatus Thorarchaeota archaeon]
MINYNQSLILIDNVEFEYPNGTKALKGVSLNVQKGEIIAIMGQNGAGKTTLIRLLNGLLRPKKGAIYYKGENISSKTIATLSEKIGIIFQNPFHQIFSNTVEDEITFSLKNLGLEKTEIKKKLDDILDRFNFNNYRNKSPLNLSGGEAKRLAIASIICREPEIIIFDEPTLGQDEGGIGFFIDLLNKEINKGTTLILVTHNIEFAIDFIPRIILMMEGRIIADGPTKEILTNYNLVTKASLLLPQIYQFNTQLRENGIFVPEKIIHEKELVEFLSSLIQNKLNN